MHTTQFTTAGTDLKEAKKVLIMLHGRGSNAEDILGLAQYLNPQDFALLAPQATNHTWYPQSFLAPTALNQPWLDSAIGVISDLVNTLQKGGIPASSIYFLGFSQGACLALEYVTRNAKRYGGVIAFTGGLIGDQIYQENYSGDFGNTPVFIGTSDPDPHVPVARVQETVKVLKEMGADVKLKIYEKMGHTINQEEIEFAKQILGA